MTAAGDDRALTRLLQTLERAGLPSLAMYKEKCLRRRLAVRMRATGAPSYEDYAALVAQNPDELSRLMQAMSISVTGFFRNPESWERLRSALPAIPRRIGDPVAAWCAGCASGEEAWTLATLLAESTAGGSSGGAPRFRLDATDVDERSMSTAREGWYPDSSFASAPRDLVRAWTEESGSGRRVRDVLRDKVRFLRQELGGGEPPEPPYDVITCRNVLIYFDRPIQERLFAQFADALRPGGLLLLGKVEAIYGPSRNSFEVVDGRERLYRRSNDD